MATTEVASRNEMERREGPSSWELIVRIQRGDREAGEVLCRRYGPRVVKLVHRLARRRPRGKVDTEDLVQSSLREVFQHLDRFEYRDEASFVAWISRIVEDKIRSSARYWASKRRARAREDGRNVDGLVGRGPTPSQEARRREETDLLYGAIDKLRARQRRIVVNRMILGLPWEVVASAEGTTVAAAQMALSRAKKTLAGILKQLEPGN